MRPHAHAFLTGYRVSVVVSDVPPVPSGCPPVDSLLGGGFERATVTQLYGPPASGKTNLALSTAVATAASDGKSLYIDTEGFSLERCRQIATGITDRVDPEAILDRLVISEVHDFQGQQQAIRDAETIADGLDLIVLDSATGFYRLERINEGEDDAGDALRQLADQVAFLLGLARRHSLAVVLTNQVFTDPESEMFRPLGGYTLEHWSGTILKLDRYRGGKRKVTLQKHRSRPAGESVQVQLTDAGIVGVESAP